MTDAPAGRQRINSHILHLKNNGIAHPYLVN